MGAFLQGLVSLLPYRNITLLAPVVALLAIRIAKPILMTYGWLENTYMKDVILGRTVPVFPPSSSSGPATTTDRTSPSNDQICVLIIAARSNHPLGMFGPGYNELGDYFTSMSAELDANAEEHGFLGQTAWQSASDKRSSRGEVGANLYFKSAEHLHAYAHGPLHTKGMQWWMATKPKHVGIMHEIFVAPKGSWEGVYVNYHPTGLGATTAPVAMDDGSTVWVNSLVEGKGKLAYSRGRMGREFAREKEWEAYEKTLAVNDGY